MPRQNVPRGLHLIRLILFLMAFTPNCTRCCPEGPDGVDGCSCKWAWENCPAQTGCGSGSGGGCNGTTSATPADLAPSPLLDSGAPPAHGQPFARRYDAGYDAGTIEPGGTVAFVATDAGTFAVVSVEANDKVRVVRIDATSWEEDPLTVRTAGEIVLLPGDAPGRVVVDGHGHALVALRHGGAIVTVDPGAVSITARRAVCDSPRDIALDEARGVTHTACASGDLVTMPVADGPPSRRVALGAELHDVGILGDSVVASAGTRVFVVSPDGSWSSHEEKGVIRVLRSSFGNVIASVSNELGPFTAEGFGPATPVTGSISDVSVLDDAIAIVVDGDAFLRSTATAGFSRVGGPGLTRAVALGEIAGDKVSRRVLALQTVMPRLLVLFTLSGDPNVVSLEPLE